MRSNKTGIRDTYLKKHNHDDGYGLDNMMMLDLGLRS
jgi:hypothetical protein